MYGLYPSLQIILGIISAESRNVVLAGKDGSKYLKDGSIKELKYNEVFTNTEKITIPQYGDFDPTNRIHKTILKK